MTEHELDGMLDDVLSEAANPAVPQGLERRVWTRIEAEKGMTMSATVQRQREDVEVGLPGFGSDLVEQGLLLSLWNSVRELVAPPKLPELVLESRPVPVRAAWDQMRGGRTSRGTWGALALHVAAMLAITFLVSQKVGLLNNARTVTVLTVPVEPKPVPKAEPTPLPKVPSVNPVELKTAEAKIKLPEVKLPDPPKMAELKMETQPLPAMAAAPARQVVAAAAPRPVTVDLAQAASVVDRSASPAAVALGRPDNPVAATSRSAAPVSLGQKGLASAAAGNTGAGPASTAVRLGSGQAGGSATGTEKRAVAGVKLGGTGAGAGMAAETGSNLGIRALTLGQAVAPQMQSRAEPISTAASAPKVLYKPRPVYTAEATAMHLEGVVSVRIRVLASGEVQVERVTKGLGHGLDEAAVKAIQATRFQAAKDAAGNAIEWTGVVNVSFQLAN